MTATTYATLAGGTSLVPGPGALQLASAPGDRGVGNHSDPKVARCALTTGAPL